MVSKCDALYPVNRARTDIGVGEGVTVSLQGTPAINANWTVHDPNTRGFRVGPLPTGPSYHFYAPHHGTTYSVIASLPQGGALSNSYAVLEPTGVAYAIIIGTSNLAGDMPNLFAGQAGAQMQLQVVMAPTEVSLANVWIAEEEQPATNVSGYFADTNVFSDPSVLSHATALWAGDFPLDAHNSWTDNCGTVPLKAPPSGWESGEFSWNVPWHWGMRGYPSIKEMGVGWSQVFAIDSNAAVTITKFNHNRVSRTTNGVVSTTDHYQP